MKTDIPQNEVLRIDAIWAVLAEGERGEGVCGARFGQNWVPLVAADEARLKSILPIARGIAKENGMKLKLVKYSVREDVEDIVP